MKGRSRGDPGKIHRSVGVWCSGVSEKKEGKGGRGWGTKEGGRKVRDEVGGTRGSEEQGEGDKAGVYGC